LAPQDQGVHKRQRIHGMENERPKGSRVFRDSFVDGVCAAA